MSGKVRDDSTALFLLIDELCTMTQDATNKAMLLQEVDEMWMARQLADPQGMASKLTSLVATNGMFGKLFRKCKDTSTFSFSNGPVQVRHPRVFAEM